jgi:magnesium transporter
MIDDLTQEVRAALAEPEHGDVPTQLGPMSPITWADVIARLAPYEMPVVLKQLPAEIVPEVTAHLEPALVGGIIRAQPRDEAAGLLERMNPDDATDVLERLPDDEAASVLEAMDSATAALLRQLMAYPPDSAGGRMTPRFVAVSPDLRADDAIRAIRRAAEQAETIYYVYVVDDAGQFVGVLSLGQLMLARPGAVVRDLMVADTASIRVDTDQEEAARLLIRRNLLAVPVLDDDDRLVGILTEDDVADVLEEEATEDIERLGGSQPLEIPYRHASIPLLFRKRIVWLLVLFVAEAYTGTVMRIFEDELEQVVALAFFVPLLLGTGGNVGSQITTTLVRAMAVGDVALRDIRWVLTKEAGVGVVIGAVMAVVAFARAEILGVGTDVAMVVALAIAVISVWASLVAAVLPLVLRRLRFDPTVVSAPFITTLVDGTGLVIYFMIAKTLLGL